MQLSSQQAGLKLICFFSTLSLICLFATLANANDLAISNSHAIPSDQIAQSQTTPEDVQVEPAMPSKNQQKQTDISENSILTPPPRIITDLNELPFPARKMRQLIYEAAKSGDIEKLRPYIGSGDDVTMLSLGGFDEDPIDFLKSISGDSSGHEILAILMEVLETDFVLMDEGSERETYVWPYFTALSIEELTPEQRVDLFKIITYGDFQDMENFGAYIFYRLGISPEGRWRFFVAGD